MAANTPTIPLPNLAGEHKIPWNGRTNAGSPVASGVYLYRLTTQSGFQESRRMVVLK